MIRMTHMVKMKQILSNKNVIYETLNVESHSIFVHALVTLIVLQPNNIMITDQFHSQSNGYFH